MPLLASPPAKRRAQGKIAGFTLIEMMIVVSIIAILAAIAIPAYSDYVQRSRIIDATSKLSDVRVKMEQAFLDNRTYVGTKPNGCPVADQPGGSGDSFNITGNCAVATYTWTATGMASKNMSGFVYTIDQANNKTTGGPPPGWTQPSPNTCWATRKDGSCG